MPSFITNLWQILFPGNHLKDPKKFSDLSRNAQLGTRLVGRLRRRNIFSQHIGKPFLRCWHTLKYVCQHAVYELALGVVARCYDTLAQGAVKQAIFPTTCNTADERVASQVAGCMLHAATYLATLQN